MEGVNPKTRQKVVVLGWTCLPGPSTRGESQNDFEQLPEYPYQPPAQARHHQPAQAASTGRCHQRQAQAAALRNLPLRSIPSLATAFTPGLRSIPSLAPALHAVSSRHPFTWPWAAMGFARAQPAACLTGPGRLFSEGRGCVDKNQ